MRLDRFLIGVLLFTLFVTMGVLIQQDIISEHDVINRTTSDFGSVYNISDDMYEQSKDLKSSTFDNEIEGADQSWESMTKGSYSAVRFMRDSFAMVGDILDAIAKNMGIPRQFVNIAMTALAVLISFALIYLVFRFIPR